MKELIERIINAMIDNPEQVQIDVIVGCDTTIYEVRAVKNDLG